MSKPAKSMHALFALFHETAAQELEVLKRYIDTNKEKPGFDINLKNPQREDITPLIATIIAGLPQNVTYLLQQPQVDCNAKNRRGQSTLIIAVREAACHREDALKYRKYTQIISILLAQPTIDVNIQDKDGFTALMYACTDDDANIVKMLCKKTELALGATSKRLGATALLLAASNDNYNILPILAASLVERNFDLRQDKDKKGNNALMLAAKEGGVESVKYLVTNFAFDVSGAVNQDNLTVLDIANKTSKKDKIIPLLTKGHSNSHLSSNKEPDMLTTQKSTTDENDSDTDSSQVETATATATSSISTKAKKTRSRRKIPITNGPAVYYLAKENRDGKRHLLDTHINRDIRKHPEKYPNGVDARNVHEQNKTPLMAAVLAKVPRHITTLLKAGANPLLTDEDKKTALDYAREVNVEEITQLIEAAVKIAKSNAADSSASTSTTATASSVIDTKTKADTASTLQDEIMTTPQAAQTATTSTAASPSPKPFLPSYPNVKNNPPAATTPVATASTAATVTTAATATTSTAATSFSSSTTSVTPPPSASPTPPTLSSIDLAKRLAALRNSNKKETEEVAAIRARKRKLEEDEKSKTTQLLAALQQQTMEAEKLKKEKAEAEAEVAKREMAVRELDAALCAESANTDSGEPSAKKQKTGSIA